MNMQKKGLSSKNPYLIDVENMRFELLIYGPTEKNSNRTKFQGRVSLF